MPILAEAESFNQGIPNFVIGGVDDVIEIGHALGGDVHERDCHLGVVDAGRGEQGGGGLSVTAGERGHEEVSTSIKLIFRYFRCVLEPGRHRQVFRVYDGVTMPVDRKSVV